ncbi:tobamovirus multiplication protein 2A-like [Bidens hawaiensis]|uniref:tobamovirus multiplication protein 2A-like n=1 Tax=Bidens hawaiensis TaxID=980011 RepID=UPI00404B454B
MLYQFLEENSEICRWVAVGSVILEGLVYLLALMLRAANALPDYGPKQQQHPLINCQPLPATVVPGTDNVLIPDNLFVEANNKSFISNTQVHIWSYLFAMQGHIRLLNLLRSCR